MIVASFRVRDSSTTIQYSAAHGLVRLEHHIQEDTICATQCSRDLCDLIEAYFFHRPHERVMLSWLGALCYMTFIKINERNMTECIMPLSTSYLYTEAQCTPVHCARELYKYCNIMHSTNVTQRARIAVNVH